MNQITAFVLSILLACVASTQPENDVDALLSRMHEASKNADVTYFDLFADDAVFFGTDLWERWTKDEFSSLYKPYMESGRGWEFKMRDRRIDIQPGGTIALFDETLFSDSFGPCRGSGAARLDEGAWKIVRYHLDITIPNGVVDEVVPVIEAFEGTTLEVVHLQETNRESARLAKLISAELPDIVLIDSIRSLSSKGEEFVLPAGYVAAIEGTRAVLYRTDRYDAARVSVLEREDGGGTVITFVIDSRSATHQSLAIQHGNGRLLSRISAALPESAPVVFDDWTVGRKDTGPLRLPNSADARSVYLQFSGDEEPVLDVTHDGVTARRVVIEFLPSAE